LVLGTIDEGDKTFSIILKKFKKWKKLTTAKNFSLIFSFRGKAKKKQ